MASQSSHVGAGTSVTPSALAAALSALPSLVVPEKFLRRQRAASASGSSTMQWSSRPVSMAGVSASRSPALSSRAFRRAGHRSSSPMPELESAQRA